MTHALIAIGLIYVCGMAIAAGTAITDWSIHRDIVKHYENEPPRFQLLRAENERKMRAAARRFTQAPAWPLTVLSTFVRIYRDSKEDS